MAGDETGAGDQVAGANRLVSEAQVRDRHGAGLLRVVDKIALRVVLRAFADNLDGVLVRPDRTVGAETVEKRADGFRILGEKRGIAVQSEMRHVILNADDEMPAGLNGRELVEHGLNHGG